MRLEEGLGGERVAVEDGEVEGGFSVFVPSVEHVEKVGGAGVWGGEIGDRAVGAVDGHHDVRVRGGVVGFVRGEEYAELLHVAGLGSVVQIPAGGKELSVCVW